MKKTSVRHEPMSKQRNAATFYDAPVKRLIIVIVVCVIMYPFLYYVDGSFNGPSFVTVLILGYSLFSFFKERKNEKRFQTFKNEYGQRSVSSGWAEKYAEFKLTNGAQRVSSGGMRSELIKRTHTKQTLYRMLIFLFLAACGYIVMFTGEVATIVLGTLFAIICTPLFVRSMMYYCGFGVAKFYREASDIERIEKSFIGGRIIQYKNNVVNIGDEYIVWYDGTKVSVAALSDIKKAEKKIVRTKYLQNAIYADDKYSFYIVFYVNVPQTGEQAKNEIELDDFRTELVLDEFDRKRYSDVRSVVIAEGIEDDTV